MKYSQHRGLTIIGVVTALILGAALSAHAQTCGAFTCTGTPDLSDVTPATMYLLGMGSLNCPDVADLDGHYLYTIDDLAWLVDICTGITRPGGCPPSSPALNPPTTSYDFVYYHKNSFPANQTTLAFRLGLAVSDTADWFNLPVKILVGGEIPAIDSIVQTGLWLPEQVGDGVLWFRRWGGSGSRIPSVDHPSRSNELCTVYLRMPESSVSRPISVTFEAVGPVQDGYKVNTPMIIRKYPNRSVVTPTVSYQCCEGKVGNCDFWGIVDLGDLSALISYATGGFQMPCPGECNVNGSGVVDLSDLSALVSYLTGGGYILPNCTHP